MTEQEKFNAELRLKTDLQDMRHSMTMQELREQREDIRRLNDKIDSLGKQLNDTNKQINDTWRQTMLGVGGMIVAVGALLFAALK